MYTLNFIPSNRRKRLVTVTSPSFRALLSVAIRLDRSKALNIKIWRQGAMLWRRT